MDDDGESVKLTFGTLPTGVTAGTTNESVVSITDDDTAGVTITPTAVTVTEGGTVTYTVVLGSQPLGDVTVTVNDPADNTDVTADPASLTFTTTDWSVAQTVTVSAAQDADDADETATVTHTVASAADTDYQGISTDDVAVTLNDDAPETLTVNFEDAAYTATEGADVDVTVTLNLDPERTVTIPINHTPQGGATSADYSGVPTNLTFNSGDTEKTFSFTATSDSAADAGESVKLTFGTLPTGVSGGATNESVVSIADLSVSFGQGTYTAAEGGSITVTVKLSVDPERTVTIPINHTPQDGATSADYSGVPTSVTFNSGDTEKTFSFAAASDGVDDDGESVKLTFGTLPTGVTAGTTNESVVSITDDDTAGVTITPTAVTVTEGGTVTYTVVLGSQPLGDVTVTVNDPADNTDVTADPASLTFTTTDWSVAQTVTVSAAQDADDADETATVTHTVASAADTDYQGISTDDVAVTLNDDAPETLTVNFEDAAYTATEGADVDVTVTLNLDPERTVTIPINHTPQGGATSADYSGVPTNLTFNSGDTEKTFSFTATSDSAADAGESVKLTFGTLPTGVSGGATNESVVSIADLSVSFGQGTYTAAEGGSITVTVKLSVDPERTVTIPINHTPQDGATSADYSGVPTSVTFNSGDTEKTFSFAAASDSVDDDGESVKLTFGTLPTGVTAGATNESVVSITDDDVPAVTVSFEQGTYTVAEGSSTTVKVQLSVAPERTVTVPINKAPQGGVTTADYSGVPTSVTFNSTDTEKTFSFAAASDGVDDDGESVKLTFGTLPTGVTAGATNESVVSITDDDVPAVTVSFEQGTYTVAEGSSTTVKVQLSVAPERTVTVPINKAPQGGVTTADYSGVPTSVTFNSTDTEKTFSFAAASDSVDDDGESVKLTFGTLPTGVTAGTTNESVVSITDDDVPAVTVSFEQGTYTVAEGSSTTVKVQLSVAPERTVTVPINKAPQGGVTSADYSGVPTNLTFNSGDTEKTFSFAAASDGVDDDGESVKLTFGTLPTGVTAGTTNESVVSITDDDTAGVTITPTAVTVTEGGTVTYTVVLGSQPLGDVTVTVNDPADNTDVTADPASLTFTTTDWSVAQTVTVSAAQDADDADETATVTHTVASAADTDYQGISTDDVAVTLNDDAPETLTVNFEDAAYTATEGADVDVTVTLNLDPERTVTIPINHTPQGGATSADYSGVPTNLTFNSGDTEKTFSFTATSDSAADAGESVKLTFGTLPTGVSGGATNESVVSIADLSVSFGQGTYTAAEGGSITVTVKLSVDPERTVTIPINHTPQDGATSADYSGVPTNLTFNSGDTEKTFSFAAASDGVDDDGESVKLTFGTLPTGVTAGTTNESVVSITDDDTAGVTITPTAVTVTEGGTVTYTVVLGSQPLGDVTVTVNDPADNTDVTADPASLTFTTTDWSVAQTVTVSAAQDADDADETATVTHTVASAADTDYQGISTDDVAVTLNDDAPETLTVNFEDAAYTATEGADVDVTVTLNLDPERTVTIPINHTPQGGATSADYSGVPTNLTFNSGDTEKTFSFTATSDSAADAGESVKLTFGTLPTGVSGGATNESVVSIADLSVSFGQGTYTAAEGGSITVTVKLSVDPERTVTIPINHTPQDGATSADYSGVPTSVTFNSGDTEKTFSFAAASDSVDDDGESVKLTFGTLPTGVTAGATNESVVSITDDDVPAVTVSFEQGTYTVAEGSSTTVKVQLSVAPERTVTVPINKAPQGGVTTADYSGVPTSVTFNSTDTEKTFSFAAASDGVDDDGESVKLTFGTLPTGVTAGATNESVVSITDDDVPAVTVSFEQGTYTVAEGSSTTVKVQLSVAPERTVTVPINKAPQGGVTTADYSGVPTSVTFNSTDTEKTFSFAAASDSVDDDGESVKLTFGTLPTGVTAGTTNESVVSITDDDVPAVTVSFEQGTYTVAEGSSTTVKVQLSVAPERTVTVPINKAPQGGVTTADYSGVPTNLTFNSGDTEKTFSFAAASDGVDDDGESVKLTFGTLPTGVTAGTTNESVVSITDDDTAGVTITPTAVTVTEGGTVTYTVVLGSQPLGDVTVTVNDPADNTDVTADPASLTFTTTDWSVAQTVTVSAAQDADDADETATVTHTVASAADTDYQGISTDDVAVDAQRRRPRNADRQLRGCGLHRHRRRRRGRYRDPQPGPRADGDDPHQPHPTGRRDLCRLLRRAHQLDLQQRGHGEDLLLHGNLRQRGRRRREREAHVRHAAHRRLRGRHQRERRLHRRPERELRAGDLHRGRGRQHHGDREAERGPGADGDDPHQPHPPGRGDLCGLLGRAHQLDLQQRGHGEDLLLRGGLRRRG